jgi:hypothetical protein
MWWIRDDGGRRQPRCGRERKRIVQSSDASGRWSRERELRAHERRYRRFSSSRAGPVEAKGFGGNNDCGLKESLRKEVVFAVGSCISTRKDGGGRLGVARPDRCGRGR